MIDSHIGATSYMVPALVHAFRYYDDVMYREVIARTAYCVITQVISKDEYTGSSLDATCPDKDSVIAAAVAMWYMAGITFFAKIKKEYLEMAVRAAQFALTYFMLWDVPLDPRHVLAKLRFKSRGWGLCSAENNHLDLVVFDFVDVLAWITDETG